MVHPPGLKSLFLWMCRMHYSNFTRLTITSLFIWIKKSGFNYTWIVHQCGGRGLVLRSLQGSAS